MTTFSTFNKDTTMSAQKSPAPSPIDFSQIKGFLFDLDGVFYHGDKPLAYGPQIIQLLNDSQRKFVAITNNSTHSHNFFSSRLQKMGVPFQSKQIINSNDAVAELLAHNSKGCYTIGSKALKARLQEAGIINSEKPETVVVGWDDGVTLQELKVGVRHLLNGAQLIGTNPDPLILTPEGSEPENGALIAFLERAASCTATIAGKPERTLFDMGVEHLGLKHAEVVMVGDTLDTDIAGALRSGLQTVLLTSGSEIPKDSAIQSTMVMSGLEELFDMIKTADATND